VEANKQTKNPENKHRQWITDERKNVCGRPVDSSKEEKWKLLASASLWEPSNSPVAFQRTGMVSIQVTKTILLEKYQSEVCNCSSLLNLSSRHC
jgi:hypothetical protein